MKYKKGDFKFDCIKHGIDNNTVEWAHAFGKHLAVTDPNMDQLKDRNGRGMTNRRGEPTYRQNLSTSQLRKFFGEIRRIQADQSLASEDQTGQESTKFKKDDLLMLKPKLAYSVGRATSENPKILDFFEELSTGIDKVDSKSDFDNFVKVIEAIVAYHKVYESQKTLLNINA